MANNSVLGTNVNDITEITEESMDSPNDNENKNAANNQDGDTPFQVVTRSGKRKSASVKGTEIAEKRAKPQDQFVAYIKGYDCNITKRHPKMVQSSIVKDFGTGIRTQLAGNSLRLICNSEVQRVTVLNADYLGSDRIITSKPRYEQGESYTRALKAVISMV